MMSKKTFAFYFSVRYTDFVFDREKKTFDFDNLHFPYPTFCRVGESSFKRGIHEKAAF